MGSVRRRLTYANVVATLALFLALTGGAVWAAGEIQSGDIARDAVKSKHIRNGRVLGEDLAPRAVGRAALGIDSVGRAQIAADAVGTVQILARAVGAEELANDAVGGAALAADSVGTDEIAPESVGSEQLAPESVGARELKPGGVEFGDIAAGAVSPRLFAHVSSNGVLAERSGGVTSAGRTSEGQYFVLFDRSLVGCVGVASVGFGFGPGVIGAGATAQVRMRLDNNPAKIGVTIYRGGYTFADVDDADFHLIVAC